jgi:O-antigen/teichoic acid export membrane protein
MLTYANKIIELFQSDTLRSRFLKSSGILTAASGIENTARLIRNMIVARILAPEEFGIMAIIISVTWSFKAFTQLGVQQCIIQNQAGGEKQFLNAAWIVSTCVGVLITLLGIIIAPVISKIYSQPMLTIMLQVCFLTILFESMISPRIYLYEKELKYLKWSLIMQGAGIINVCVSICLSLYLRNVWALIIALLAEASFRLISSYIICPFLPSKAINKKYFMIIVKFSMGIIGLPILLMIFTQADVFYLGKMVTLEEVGKYSLALILARTIHMIYTMTVGRLMIPLFSKVQNDLNRFRKNYLSLIKSMCIYGIPMITFICIYSEPIITLAYGQSYSTVSMAYTVLCVSFYFTLLNELTASCFISLAKPEMYRNYSFIRVLVIIIVLYPLIKYYGLNGAAISVLIATFIFWLLLLNKLDDIIQFKVIIYLKYILFGATSSLFVISVGLPICNSSIRSMILKLCIGFISCFVTWLLFMRVTYQFKEKMPYVLLR